jgi:hypothetical protein
MVWSGRRTSTGGAAHSALNHSRLAPPTGWLGIGVAAGIGGEDPTEGLGALGAYGCTGPTCDTLFAEVASLRHLRDQRLQADSARLELLHKGKTPKGAQSTNK